MSRRWRERRLWVGLALLTALIPLASCHDSDSFTAEDKAQLVQRQRDHLNRMRAAEATVRAFSDPHTVAGQRSIREAVELRHSAENMVDIAGNFQDKE